MNEQQMDDRSCEREPMLLWGEAHLERLQVERPPSFPIIEPEIAIPVFDDIDVWDSWPLQHPNGQTVSCEGHEYWFMLSSPKLDDPRKRHDHARIRLVSFCNDQWFDCGYAMPDNHAPGNREWAGSAVLESPDQVTLYFTAAGRKDVHPSFEQRLFKACATLAGMGEKKVQLVDWTTPVELVKADGAEYMVANQTEGKPGTIKAFRDPAFFQNPVDGRNYLLFTGSAAWSNHPFNGVIGLIELGSGNCNKLLPALISAVGLNNELERPHVQIRDGRYYLFWSTQRDTFNPEGPVGPNGLYAAVADHILGPWNPVNGSGLVVQNPDEEPLQSYSWWVTGESDAIGFIDFWGLESRNIENDPELARQHFGGTPTPRYALQFDGNRVTLADNPAST